MIRLHRLGSTYEPFHVNPDLIATVEGHPDVVLTLTNGTKLVIAEAEHDELARDDFLGHDSVIGPDPRQLEGRRQVERMASAMMSTRQRRTVATISSAVSATTSLVPLVSVSTTSG